MRVSDASPEVVRNGSFDSDTLWTAGAGWTIGAGAATHTAGTIDTLSQSVSISPGGKYRMQYEVSNRTAGAVTVQLGGTAGTPRSSDGTFRENIVCGGSDTLVRFIADLPFDGSLDGVSVTPAGRVILR